MSKVAAVAAAGINTTASRSSDGYILLFAHVFLRISATFSPANLIQSDLCPQVKCTLLRKELKQSTFLAR